MIALGKKAAVIDARMPQLAGHRMASVAAPAKIDRSAVAFSPGLYRNDRIGDCTAAGLANAARAQAALGGFDIGIAEEDVVRFYSASTGYDAEHPGTDKGGVETDVLAYRLKTGFRTAGQTPLVGEWATIDPSDFNALRNVVAWVGAAYIGVQLAMSDQSPGLWDVGLGAGDCTPGSWGGHCICLWDYQGTEDESLVTLLSWGTRRLATWRWLRSRMDEAHAVFWRQLFTPSGLNFAGVDYEKLCADNENWAGSKK